MSVKTTDVRTLSRNFKDYGDKEVTVAGWVRNMRDSKTFGFLVLADGTFFNPVQVVFNQGRSICYWYRYTSTRS